MALASVFVLGTFSLGPVSPASAATIPPPITDPDIGHLDFDTPTNAAAYKTTVPSSVLKDAAKIRAASRGTNIVMTTAEVTHLQSQVAANMRQTRGAKLAAATNGPSVRDWTAAQRAQPATAATITRQAANVSVPATPMTKMGKLMAGANVASAITTGAYVGFQVGKGVSNSMGLDATGGLCSPTFEDGGWVAILTGTDCTEFFTMPPGFAANTDAVAGVTSGFCTSYTGWWAATGAPYANKPPTSADCGGGNAAWRQDTAWTVMGYGTIDAVTVNANRSITITTTQQPYETPNYGAIARPSINFVCYTPRVNAPGVWDRTNGGSPLNANRKGGTDTATYQPSTSCAKAGSIWVLFLEGHIAAGTNYYTPSPGGIAFVEGQPLRPLQFASADPERTLDCVIATTDGQQFKATSAKFTEGTGILAEPVCPAVPDGLVAESITVTESPAVPGGAPIPLLDTETTEGYQRLAEDFPECLSGMCYADLRQVQPDTGTGVTTQSCFDDLSADACLDWYKNPNKADQYVCEYGGQLVALTECGHYANVFDPAKQAAGQPYSDPDTGVSAPVGSAPSTSPMNDAVLDPSKPRNCWPTGWGILNPLDWVMKPVGCALQAAFVPRPLAVSAMTTGFQTSWQAATPVQLATQLAAVADLEAPTSGCHGIAINMAWVPFAELGTYYFLPACPGDFFAPWAPMFKALATVGIFIAGFFGLTRHVGGIFGYGGVGEK